MKLQAQVGDETHEVEIRREGRLVFASVDGREYELEASEPEPNSLLIKHENRIYRTYVAPANDADGNRNVSVNGKEFAVKLIDPKRLRGSASADAAADGVAEIKTAMPGKVVRILLKAGAEVEKGDAILVVEAMKMQNELRSPKAGTVKDIRVSEGQTVASGDILAIVE